LRFGPQLKSNACGVAGGFYSTQDADSEGEEDKFFVWTPDEVDALLGGEDGPLFRAYFDVTEAGNASPGSAHSFEHKNILHVDHSLEKVAARLHVTPERLAVVIERGTRILFEAREKRIKPGRDDKILTAWNGLMLASMAKAGVVLRRPDTIQAAAGAAEFCLTRLRDGSGRLLRSLPRDRKRQQPTRRDDTSSAGGGSRSLSAP